MSGNEIDLPSPDSSGNPNEIGSGVQIGDGFALTAGHVVYEFNDKNKLSDRSVISLPSQIVYWDPRNYYTQYLAAVAALSDPLPTPDAGRTISDQFVEPGLAASDIVMIGHSGSVDSSDAGLVLYLDTSMLLNPDSGLTSGTTIKRYGRTSGTTVGVASSLVSGGYRLNVGSAGGDSGGPHEIHFEDHNYVLGVSTTTNGSSTRASLFSRSEFYSVNTVLSFSQSGNVSDSEPTNLIVGSNAVDTVSGTYRADVLLGRGGDDNLSGGDLGVVWGNDQIFGGDGNDTMSADRGSDLFYGGDFRAYGGVASNGIDSDGVDTATYAAITEIEDVDKGISISVASHSSQSNANSADQTYKDISNFGHAVFVTDLGRDQSTDTLISVENLIGTSADDILNIKDLDAAIVAGSSGQGGLATVDMGAQLAGADHGDKIDLTNLAEGAKIKLGNDGYVEAKTDSSRHLAVKGVERVLGSAFDDVIIGSANADNLTGNAGSDEFTPGGGGDIIWGDGYGVDAGQPASGEKDTVKYDDATSPIRIVYDGSGVQPAITVQSDGTDQLHSIEEIVGTKGRDILSISGAVLDDNLTVDANGGQSGGGDIQDLVSGKSLANAMNFSVDQAGNGTFTDTGSAHHITLANFHTGVIGTAHDDLISDLSDGPKTIDAGEGNNTVTVGGSGARVMARWGDDTITGSDGNDVIVSGGGTDTVDGGAGDDFISENDGAAFGTNQLLNGGSGNDWIDVKRSSQAVVTGGTGDDTIDVGGTWGVTVHFGTGDGHDSIVGRAGTGTETPENVPDNPVVTVDLGALSAADCTLVWDYDTQMISPPSGMPLDIPGIYQLAGEATLLVNSTGESIYLGVLYGEALGVPDNYPELDGDPILSPGSQTFSGYDFKFANGTVDGSDPADAGLVVQHGDAGSYNIAPGEYQTSQANDTGNTTGTSGDDSLVGGNAGGTINAGAGNDTIYAAHGAYTIDGGDGADTYDVFGGWNDYSFSLDNGELVVSSGTGFEGEARLTGVESIFFDTELTSVSMADIIATLSGPGNDTVIGTQFNDGLTGQAGDDVILGRAGNDFINGGTGNDTLIGGGGDDYYDYVPGDGDDIINDYGDGSGGSGGNDTLELEDVLSTDVTVSLGDSGRDLVLTLAGGGSVTLQGAVQDSNKQIEQVYFADGMMWSADDLLAQVATVHGSVGDDTVTGTSSNDILYGAAGDDTLQGLEGNDVLNGGTGNDTLYGGDGDDVYRFAAGDGQDVVADFTWGSAGTGGLDTLQFGGEILPADVIVSQANDGADLVLTFAGSSDSITISSAITASQFRIEHVTFIDGTSWSYSDLMAKAMTPTAGNDTFYGDETIQSLNGGAGNDSLYGRQGDDILTGGTGNDYLNGGPGSDTYIFTQGDGSDTIDDSRNASWINAIQLGAGMTQQNTFITTSANGLDVVVGFVDSSDTIAIRYMNISTGNGIDQIRFVDGSSWSYADIMARRTAYTAGDDTITGTSGNETLYGGDGNDTLLGLAGNDSLAGGTGNDTLTGGTGDDLLNGGSGTDTAVFAGVESDYQLITSGGTVSITDLVPTISGDDGTDQLIGVETAQFSDQSVSLAAPVILDLDGNGVTLAAKTGGTRFDWNGDGVADRTGWTAGGDGFLALDRNHDGRIDSAAELSFTSDKPGARSDLDGLSAFDSNGDGKLSADDSAFGDFRVWQDADANGVSDAGEVMSLTEAGVVAIDLTGAPVNQSWAWDANVTINTGTFERTDGGVGQLTDAALSYAPSTQTPAVGVEADLERPGHWPRPLELTKLFDSPRLRMPISALGDHALANDGLDHFRAASSFSEQLAAFVPESGPDWTGRHQGEKADDTWFASHRRPDGGLLTQSGASIF